MNMLVTVDHETREQALDTVLQESWRGELELAERWTFTQALEKVLEGFEADGHAVRPELRARHRVLTWIRHSTNFQTMEREALGALTSLARDERDLTLELLASCIDAQDPTHRKPLRRIVSRMQEQVHVLNDLEGGLLGSGREAEDAWLNLFVKRFLAQRAHGSQRPSAPPVPPPLAERLALRLLEDEFPSVPAHSLRDFRLMGLSRLSPEDLSSGVRLRIVQDMLDGQYLPLGGYGAPVAGAALETLIQAARQAGTLPPLTLAAIRRSAFSGVDADHLNDWKTVLTPELNPGEAWSDAFLARLDALSPEQRQPWPALLAFARTASVGKPSTKWLKEGERHLKAVGLAPFREVLTAALPLLSRSRTFALEGSNFQGADVNLVIEPFNALSLKGLLWLVPLAADDALTRAVALVVESALKKVPGVGPRDPKIANAAVYALSRTESGAALSALARLATTVTFKGTLKEVQKGLEVVAERLHVTPDDLLELGVPTLGLSGAGARAQALGDVEARLKVDGGGAHLSFNRGGKALKSMPAAVKKDFAEELADLRAAQKEAEKTVASLSQRLDGLMIQPRVWRGEAWLERYLAHPLAGTVARRLLWLVDGVPALWADSDLRNSQHEPVSVLPTSEVALWHPIGRDVEEVLAWRTRLESLDIRQPFKQAWREVYVLTDAERRTDTYSNRFAGHILKQHQFHALAALRGWRNRLRLMVDDSYPPAMRDLPAYGLRAEYWIEGVGEDYSTDSTDSGTYLRLGTDQVRFYPLGAPENHAHAGGGGYTMWVNQTQQPVAPLPLEQIPPRVLSEVLRDVDLFVGVASVGNDPTWQDGGPGGRFREYWQSYSFGELTETARTRAAYLARLIPRLQIRERLSLDGRFLRVRGERRGYKIHLGSGNILMEPNDQYLCIIPGGRGSGPDVDFDGDRVLSLVLSKAFLLADDTAITDPVILQQIGR